MITTISYDSYDQKEGVIWIELKLLGVEKSP